METKQSYTESRSLIPDDNERMKFIQERVAKIVGNHVVSPLNKIYVKEDALELGEYHVTSIK